MTSLKSTLIVLATVTLSAAIPAQTPVPVDREQVIESFMQERIEFARGMLDRGELERAGKMLEAVLELAPDGPARREAVRLRRAVRVEEARTTVVKGEIVTADDRFALNELIEVQLRLTNTGDSTLVIPQMIESGGEIIETIATATIVFRIFDPNGSVISLSSSVRVPVEGNIEIMPGASWTTSFLVDPGEHYRSVQAVRTYTITATLRPSEMRLPSRQLYLTVTFPERELKVFPLGWDRVASDPLRYMQTFMARGMTHELAVASWLVPEELQGEAVARLVESLAGADSVLSEVISACLKRITGESEQRDAEAWSHWWQNVAPEWKPPTRPSLEQPAEDEDDVPDDVEETPEPADGSRGESGAEPEAEDDR